MIFGSGDEVSCALNSSLVSALATVSLPVPESPVMTKLRFILWFRLKRLQRALIDFALLTTSMRLRFTSSLPMSMSKPMAADKGAEACVAPACCAAAAPCCCAAVAPCCCVAVAPCCCVVAAPCCCAAAAIGFPHHLQKRAVGRLGLLQIGQFILSFSFFVMFSKLLFHNLVVASS